MAHKIFTLRDAENERWLMEANMERRLQVRETKAKVRHWKKQVEKYGGEIQKETLARFEKKLKELLR